MPLLKTKIAQPTALKTDEPTQGQLAQVEKVRSVVEKPHKAEMTKDDYWRRREERDIETSKNMAWSGLAQAALMSVSVCQLNIDNTEDGLVDLVSRLTNKLLAKRDNK